MTPFPPGAPHSAALLGGIATRLDSFAEDAEQFGLVLCSDGDVAGRYLVQLQQIDRLAQSLREMARVLAARDPDAAVAAICLGELRGALERCEAD
jgi:ABC-type transporter Mla subunit MlaD